jgi:drug/metabolite transporter (DMT)-like permease
MRRFPIGWGIGGVEEHPQRFGRTTAENVVIQAWMQTGLFGVVLLLSWFWSAIWLGGRYLRRDRTDFVALFAVGVMLSVVAQGIFGYSLGDPTVQVLVAIAMTGIGVLAARTPAQQNE